MRRCKMEINTPREDRPFWDATAAIRGHQWGDRSTPPRDQRAAPPPGAGGRRGGPAGATPSRLPPFSPKFPPCPRSSAWTVAPSPPSSTCTPSTSPPGVPASTPPPEPTAGGPPPEARGELRRCGRARFHGRRAAATKRPPPTPLPQPHVKLKSESYIGKPLGNAQKEPDAARATPLPPSAPPRARPAPVPRAGRGPRSKGTVKTFPVPPSYPFPGTRTPLPRPRAPEGAQTLRGKPRGGGREGGREGGEDLRWKGAGEGKDREDALSFSRKEKK